jgi:hypothetical protein
VRALPNNDQNTRPTLLIVLVKSPEFSRFSVVFLFFKMITFYGYVEAPQDAMLLFEACRLGLLKRVERRLSDSERIMYVKSGSVFIWDEEESGIKR